MAGDGQAEDGFGRVDAVTSGQRDIGPGTGGAAAFEHATGHGRRKFFDRPTKDRNGHQRRAAHGVNIANGIHRSDLSEVEGVIDDGHEKIRGADHRLTVAEIAHGGVVLGIVAHEQLRVRCGFAGLVEDFLQHLGRDLAATTGAMAVLGQANGIGGVSHGRWGNWRRG